MRTIIFTVTAEKETPKRIGRNAYIREKEFEKVDIKVITFNPIGTIMRLNKCYDAVRNEIETQLEEKGFKTVNWEIIGINQIIPK